MTDEQTEIYRSQYRLPKPIADWLKAKAASNFRSVNAELVAIVHDAMLRSRSSATRADKADHS